MHASDTDLSWIEALTDEECRDVFWLYVESPDDFLAQHPPALLGEAMRFALREVARLQSDDDEGEG